jgi:hypothetical protein
LTTWTVVYSLSLSTLNSTPMPEHLTPAKAALRGHTAIVSGQFYGVIEPIRQLVNAVPRLESWLVRAQPMPSRPTTARDEDG